MSGGDLNWIANFIRGIADDVLRDLYVRGKYRDVILPMLTVAEETLKALAAERGRRNDVKRIAAWLNGWRPTPASEPADETPPLALAA